MTIEYRLLGPVEAWLDGQPLTLGGGKPRTILAVLLLHAGDVVSSEALIDHVWGDDPPASARNLLHGYVSRLRSVLSGPRLQTRPPGYRLCVEPGELDLRRFDGLLGSARAALVRGESGTASDLLREGLALWHGPALGGITSEGPLRTESAALEERRLEALEVLIDAELQSGRHESVLGELRTLVARHPLRAGLRQRLMVALSRGGRRGEALEVYESGREALLRDLGVEPDRELRQLAQQIRDSDPSLSPLPPAREASPPRQVPDQVPAAIADFTGREAELAELCRGFGAEHGGPPMRLCVVTGAAGVGKTTLAIQIAHRLRPRFPDGMLFVDLRGVAERPLRPVTVLASLLRALGVDGAAIPSGLADRAAVFRARLVDRRVLVILDNAASEAQIRPLLPSGDGCATIVTSRSALSGLEAAHAVPLGVLQGGAALDLLAAVAGVGRVAAEPDAAWAVVELCGRLPLAVRIAGARLTRRPHRTLATLSARLRDERHRLDELRAGDLEVRASLALSYRALDPAARRAFRLLAVLEAPDVPAWLAAALLDLDPPAVEELLERLEDAHLLEAAEDCAGAVRYRFHELVRLLARELLREDDPALRQAALERALGTELALAQRAHRALSPGNASHLVRGRAPRRAPWPVHAGAVDDDPMTWFETERACLVAGVEQAGAGGPPDLAWELACSLTTFFGIRGHWQDWRSTHELAIAAARRDGSRPGEAQGLEMLGVCNLWLGDVREAAPCFERCLALARELGDRHLEASGLYGVGLMAAIQGDPEAAGELLGRSVAHFREVGDRHGEACVLLGAGQAEWLGGRVAEALAALSASHAIFRDRGDRHWEAIALLSLADCHRAAGETEMAGDCLARSLEVFEAVGNRHFAARALYRLARLRTAGGQLHEARSCLDECVRAFAQLGLRLGEARALHRLGRVLADLGDRDGAAAAWARSLAISTELGAADAAVVSADLGSIPG